MNRKQTVKKAPVILGQHARRLHIGIVVAKFNEDITEKLLEGAKKTLLANGVTEKNIEVAYVPGGFEIPLACQRMAESKQRYDALIAIGCVIRGDTDHYVYIANEATRGTMDVMLMYNMPIANCILTVNTLKQARERCGKVENKGSEAAEAVLEMVRI